MAAELDEGEQSGGNGGACRRASTRLVCLISWCAQSRRDFLNSNGTCCGGAWRGQRQLQRRGLARAAAAVEACGEGSSSGGTCGQAVASVAAGEDLEKCSKNCADE